MPMLWPFVPFLYLPFVPKRVQRFLEVSVRKKQAVARGRASRLRLPAPASNAALVVVGLILVLGNLWYGFRHQTAAWPLSCYPTFAFVSQPVHASLSVEILEQDGTVKMLKPHELIPGMGSVSRLSRLLQRTLERRNERDLRAGLAAIWQIMERQNPRLQQAKAVSFYRTTYSVEPEDVAADAPPVEQTMLYRFEPASAQIPEARTAAEN